MIPSTNATVCACKRPGSSFNDLEHKNLKAKALEFVSNVAERCNTHKM
jgi:hypothetical protein